MRTTGRVRAMGAAWQRTRVVRGRPVGAFGFRKVSNPPCGRSRRCHGRHDLQQALPQARSQVRPQARPRARPQALPGARTVALRPVRAPPARVHRAAARRENGDGRRPVARCGLRRLLRDRSRQPLPPASARLARRRPARPAGVGLLAHPGPAHRHRPRRDRAAPGQTLDGLPPVVRPAPCAVRAARPGATVRRGPGGRGRLRTADRAAQHRRVVPVAVLVHPGALRRRLGRDRVDPAARRRQDPRDHGPLEQALDGHARPARPRTPSTAVPSCSAWAPPSAWSP